MSANRLLFVTSLESIIFFSRLIKVLNISIQFFGHACLLEALFCVSGPSIFDSVKGQGRRCVSLKELYSAVLQRIHILAWNVMQKDAYLDSYVKPCVTLQIWNSRPNGSRNKSLRPPANARVCSSRGVKEPDQKSIRKYRK